MVQDFNSQRKAVTKSGNEARVVPNITPSFLFSCHSLMITKNKS